MKTIKELEKEKEELKKGCGKIEEVETQEDEDKSWE